MLKLILNIGASLLAILGYFLAYKTDQTKLRRYKKWFIFGALLSIVLIWGDYIIQRSESESIKNQNYKLSIQIDTFQEQSSKLKLQNDTLILQQAKLIDDNKKLLKFRLESKIQSQIVLVENRTDRRQDPRTKLIYTHYIFRSRTPIPARDVSILLTFDGSFENATARISGAVVIEQGTKTSVNPEHTMLSYSTGYLSESNDVIIEVISKNPLNIIGKKLSP